MEQFMEQVAKFLALLGIDPKLAGLGFILAVMLRYARGMVHRIGDGWTYGLAFGFGLLGAGLNTDGTLTIGTGLLRGLARDTLYLAFIVLLLQKGLAQLAKVVPFLPQDNEWAPPPTPPSNP